MSFLPFSRPRSLLMIFLPFSRPAGEGARVFAGG